MTAPESPLPSPPPPKRTPPPHGQTPTPPAVGPTPLTVAQRQSALSAVQDRLRACRLCLDAGHDIYPRAIFSGGIGAKFFLIGQAPGVTEKDTGRPFNAGSGTRLFRWLAQAGIQEDWFRRTQYIGAITRCYPGRSRSGSGDRVPSHAEQMLCRPYLTEEISLVDPEVILAVGRLAIGLFYPPSTPLDEIIGTEKQVDGRWIVPLPHPSGASRWHQLEPNRRKIAQAIDLIRRHAQRLGV